MGIISNSFDLREEVFKSAGISTGDYLTRTPNPKTVVGEYSPRRVNFKQIDYVYNNDPYSYATINKPIQWILNAGFRLSSPKKSTLTFFNKFFDNIGLLGDEVTEEELHDDNFRDLGKYGNSYIELIPDMEDNIIIDIRKINPSRVDYARDRAGKIAIDNLGKPIGYVIEQNQSSFNNRSKKSSVPESLKGKILVKGSARFVEAHRIAHFKFNKDSNGYWGNGWLQPALISIIRRLKIEEAEVNTIYTKSQQPLIANVGDERHEASEDDLNNVVKVLSNIKHDRIFAFPDWVKVGALQTASNESAGLAIDRLSTANSAASGVPMGFLTGKDGDAQRGTLSAMQTMLESNLDYYIKSYTSQFKKLVIDRIAKSHGIDNEIKFVWNTVVSEDKNDKIKRLFTAFQMGAISPEEIRTLVINSEDLERNDESYKKMIEEKSAVKDNMANNSNKNLKLKTQPNGSQSGKDQNKRELMKRKQ